MHKRGRDQRSLPTVWGHIKEEAIYYIRQEVSPYQKPNWPGPNLGLQASRRMRNKFLLFKPPLCGILLPQPGLTKTVLLAFYSQKRKIPCLSLRLKTEEVRITQDTAKYQSCKVIQYKVTGLEGCLSLYCTPLSSSSLCANPACVNILTRVVSAVGFQAEDRLGSPGPSAGVEKLVTHRGPGCVLEESASVNEMWRSWSEGNRRGASLCSLFF